MKVKDIRQVEEEVRRDIEWTRMLDSEGIKSTVQIFKGSLMHVLEAEHQTRDFFFAWLPQKVKKYLKLLIPFLVMVLILLIPSGSYEIRASLALFACVALLWTLEPISMIVTALLIPILSVLLQLKTEAVFSSFANPIVYLILSGLILGQAFRTTGFDRILAVKVIAFSRGNTRLLLFNMMLVTALLGMWLSNTATVSLMIPMISFIIEKTGRKHYAGMLLLACGFASSIGGLTTILGGNPNAITAAFLLDTGFTFFDWTIVGAPLAIILFLVSYLIFLRIYRLKGELIDISAFEKEAKVLRLTYDQKKLLVIFFPTLFLWIFGSRLSFLPRGFERPEMIGLACCILLFSFNVLKWDDVRKLPWEIFLLVGGGLMLGEILSTTGAASLIAGKIFSVVNAYPKIIILCMVVALAMFLSNFINNSSATIVLVPVLISLSPLLSIDARLLSMAAAMSTAVCALTPVASPAFALVYGTGLVRRDEMMKVGLANALLCGTITVLFIWGFYKIS